MTFSLTLQHSIASSEEMREKKDRDFEETEAHHVHQSESLLQPDNAQSSDTSENLRARGLSGVTQYQNDFGQLSR